MSDYQLRARIPHELADEVKDLIEEVNEKFPAAEATFSTVARQALQDTIRHSRFFENKIIPLELPIKDLKKDELEVVLQGLTLISSVIQTPEDTKNRVEDAILRVQDAIEWIEFQEFKKSQKKVK